MKIRTGFVSNSSSSSFLLYFENFPQSKEELLNILFGNEPPNLLYDRFDNAILYSDDILNKIYLDLSQSDKYSVNDIFLGYENGDTIISIYSESIEFLKKYISTDDMDEYLILQKEFEIIYEKLNKDDSEENQEKNWNEYKDIENKILKLMNNSFQKKFKNGIFIDLEYGNYGEEINTFLENSINIFNKILIQYENNH